MQLQHFIHHVSSRITSVDHDSASELSGSGFYLESKGQWFVTNRHNVCRADGSFFDEIVLYTRFMEDGELVWDEYEIGVEEAKDIILLHKDSNVDVALISVDSVFSEMKKYGVVPIVSFLDESHFPTEEKFHDFFQISSTDDVVVIGYPNRFFDEKNLFPIVKRGIISSGWGLSFDDKGHFLIDCRLFTGSSGSVVITKPIYQTHNPVGAGTVSSDPQFWLLGIYCNEPVESEEEIVFEEFSIKKRTRTDLGVVHYWHSIAEMVK
jgi:hypothetical protein